MSQAMGNEVVREWECKGEIVRFGSGDDGNVVCGGGCAEMAGQWMRVCEEVHACAAKCAVQSAALLWRRRICVCWEAEGTGVRKRAGVSW